MASAVAATSFSVLMALVLLVALFWPVSQPVEPQAPEPQSEAEVPWWRPTT